MNDLPGVESLRRMLRRNHSLFLVLAGWLLLISGGIGCTPGSSRPTQTEAAPSSASRSEPTGGASSARTAASPSASAEDRTVAGRLEDAAVETRIRMALADRKSLRPFDFRPDVQNGRVRLRGDVTTREQRRQAEQTARAVDGVNTLVNEVTVQGRRPALAESTDSPPDDPSAVYYTVEAGDTLWNIAQDHRASISRLKDLNNLSSGSLQPGQRIRIR